MKKLLDRWISCGFLMVQLAWISGAQDVAPKTAAKSQEEVERARVNATEGGKIPAGKKGSNPQREPKPYSRKPDLADVAYGPHERNKLDLWKAKSEQPAPLVVFFHPGGFSIGDKTWIPPILLETCLKKGLSVATANYRYSFQARYPAQMEDCARVIQFLRLHAGEWNINPKTVAATGSSAGGGISVWLAFHEDQADPVSPDPVKRQSTRLPVIGFSNGQTTYDLREVAAILGEQHARKMGSLALGTMFGVARDEDALATARVFPLYEDSSGLRHVKAGDPPVFMYYSYPMRPITTDTPQDEVMHNPRFGAALKERMDKLGIECVLRTVDDYPGNPGERPAKFNEDLVDFFLRHFPAP